MTHQKKEINLLKKLYRSQKSAIVARLKDFQKVGRSCDSDIFAELCFCILTPQSKATACDEIVRELQKRNLLLCGSTEQLRPHLKKTRFYRKKSTYVCGARALFKENGKLRIKDKVCRGDVVATREWLVKNIKGIGHKEASHFLRNIGRGAHLAILDIHILRNLKKLGVIKAVPASLTRTKYLHIEEKLKDFAQKVKIPPDHLDLLFWSSATGKIFK